MKKAWYEISFIWKVQVMQVTKYKLFALVFSPRSHGCTYGLYKLNDVRDFLDVRDVAVVLRFIGKITDRRTSSFSGF